MNDELHVDMTELSDRELHDLSEQYDALADAPSLSGSVSAFYRRLAGAMRLVLFHRDSRFQEAADATGVPSSATWDEAVAKLDEESPSDDGTIA